jgi:hypothetical protein
MSALTVSGSSLARRDSGGPSLIEFHKIWVDQCEAARDIKEAFGQDKALGYLIGEKVLNFLEASDQHPEFADELPQFVAEIRQIFEPAEIRTYLDGVRRVGALGHTASDEAYEDMCAAGAVPGGPVEWAEQILLLERTRALLLP